MREYYLPTDRQSIYHFLRQRFNRPNQTANAQVERLAARSPHADPREVWEIVGKELGNTEWLQSDHREFGEHIPGKLIFAGKNPSTHRSPTSLVAIATIASDPNGMLKAESHARQFAQALTKFGAIFSGKTVWYFTDNPYTSGGFETPYMGRAYVKATEVVYNSPIADDYEMEHDEISERLPLPVQEAVLAWECWNTAASRGLRIDNPPVWECQFFSDLPNPFEPLLAFWTIGYRISIDLSEEDSDLHLYAKPFELQKS